MDTAPSAQETRKTAERIPVERGSEPGDWQAVYECLNRHSRAATAFAVKGCAALATLAGVLATAAVLGLAVMEIHPNVSLPYLACFVLPPALLAGAAAGQAAGNLFLSLRFRLSESARRGFANRLTLARVPDAWAGEVRNWLFSGDWLTAPTHDMRFPYVRIFITGSVPADCDGEDAIWRRIHRVADIGESGREAGGGHRELSYLPRFPGWMREMEKGDGIAELAKRIGARPADDWVAHLWRRACRQWPLLGEGVFPGAARRECFEMQHLILADGREAFIITLRPVAQAAAETPESDLAGDSAAA